MYDFIRSLKLDDITSWEAEYILAKARGEDNLLLEKHNQKGETWLDKKKESTSLVSLQHQES